MKRLISRGTCEAEIRYSGTGTLPPSRRWRVPIPTPGDTASPFSRTSGEVSAVSCLVEGPSVFIEPALYESGKCIQCRFGLRPLGTQFDFASWSGREHHQAHDRASGYLLITPYDRHCGRELPGELHELCGSPGVQTASVAYEDAAHRAGLFCLLTRRQMCSHQRLASSLKSWEATLMYLRPASCACNTAFDSRSRSRSWASLISIGRLIPAMTSTRP